jgi:hypothetical protein
VLVADPSRLALNQLVNRARQPNLPAFLAPSDSPKLHLATVAVVDPGRNEVTVTLNEPIGDPTVRGVPVLGPDMPSVGDLVQMIQTGKSLAVLGRQYRPAGSVTF